MTTELLIEYIRNSWWIWLFVICMTSYFIYSFVKDRAALNKARDRKKELEKELVALEAEYSEKARKLEEKYEEKKKFFSSRGEGGQG
ncbi:MAG: hypothetical protein ABH860_00665 [bacterium]